jgi:acetyl esterase/lipase
MGAEDTLGLQKLATLSDKKTDTQGAVLADHENLTLYIVFRGTEDWKDMLIDSRCNQFTVHIRGNECKVHNGFHQAYDSVQTIIESLPYHELKNYTIVVCGHSLGGALATLCAAYLNAMRLDNPINVVTFGSPRCGNDKFANIFDATIVHHYRFIHDNDVVPMVPKVNYQHTKTEIRLDDDGNEISYMNLWKRILYWIKGKRKLDLEVVSVKDHFMDNYIRAVTKWLVKHP